MSAFDARLELAAMEKSRDRRGISRAESAKCPSVRCDGRMERAKEDDTTNFTIERCDVCAGEIASEIRHGRRRFWNPVMGQGREL